jgi:hypothetical protein
MKFISLFPEIRNAYKGSKIVVVIALLLAIVSTVRSLIHIFLPDGGAGVVAGLVLDGPLASAVIFTFAWSGLYQLIFAMLQWLVLVRYREFIPVILLLIFFEQVSLLLIPMFKPISDIVMTHTPPEVIGNKILLPFMLIMFVLSLIQKEE